ncbi:hypothetical protein MPY17_39575 (plasmid) [Rhodococcus opacus]|uniref:hypothetical protein n=1 Tax=Rhodococcus opacus TaxID=37919 RepID=UPI001FF5B23D|nr:hypothetical protein [Rhodococcus opacus]UOT08499.1 hypothetical protein MPY17_39575 [Rhodococcus opacus]
MNRLRGELADLRTQARADRHQVRADHTANWPRPALTTALRAAEQMVEELRRQPGGRGADT